LEQRSGKKRAGADAGFPSRSKRELRLQFTTVSNNNGPAVPHENDKTISAVVRVKLSGFIRPAIIPASVNKARNGRGENHRRSALRSQGNRSSRNFSRILLPDPEERDFRRQASVRRHERNDPKEKRLTSRLHSARNFTFLLRPPSAESAVQREGNEGFAYY